MNFLQLKNLTASLLDDLQFGYFTVPQVEVWLNNAQLEVQKRLIKAGQNYYLKCVQTVMVINQSDYVLPEDFKKEHRLEIVISGTVPNEAISPVVPITLNQKDFVSTGTGAPGGYFFKRDRFVILPAPDSPYILRLYYSYQVKDMVLDVDIPDVPPSYAELIALLAVHDGFLKDGRIPDIIAAKIATYQAQLDSDANERNQDVPRQIVATGAFDSGVYEWNY